MWAGVQTTADHVHVADIHAKFLKYQAPPRSTIKQPPPSPYGGCYWESQSPIGVVLEPPVKRNE